MYGDGYNTKMMKDIIGTANQIFDGAAEATGLNVKSIIAGFLGGKLSIGNAKQQPNEPSATDSDETEE